MERNRKRIIGGALFLAALTLLLCARLFYIQIFCHEEFAEAVKQQIILRPEDASDMRRALLYLNLLNETRAMIRKVLLLAKIQRKFVLGW